MKTNDPISAKQANRSKIGERPPRQATPRKRLACRVKTHFDASAAALDPAISEPKFRMPRACLLLAVVAALLASTQSASAARLKDLVSIEGVRDNMLLGYGVVVGLNGTGDRQQTVFSTQSLSNLLQKMGVNVPPTALRVNNVAAVMVTASLPAFATPGLKIDLTVSSIGDAATLQGGMLLLTSLKAANGEVYAVAQGALSIGGFSAGRGGSGVQVNHPTVGRIPEGGRVEKAAPTVEPNPEGFRLQLRHPDFVTASRLTEVLNKEFPTVVARAENAATVMVTMPPNYHQDPVKFIALIDRLEVPTDRQATVVLNERTGTVVIGNNVTIAPVAVLHGNLTVQIVTDFVVSQPPPFSSGETVVAPQVGVEVNEEQARQVVLKKGASVEELVKALMSIGSTPRDIIAIVQSIAAAGSLDAQLEVI
jgi:flagellar P-ring protein precursor FlgI